MLVRDAMSGHVVTVRPHMPVRAATALLVAGGFTSAPVVSAEGALFGIVTRADLTRGLPLPDPEHADATADTTAAEVMTPKPATVRPADDVADAVDVMRATGWRAVPVVDDGRLVGIVSRSDVQRCAARPEPGARVVDAELIAASRG